MTAIIVGVVTALATITAAAIGVWCQCKKRKNQQQEKDQPVLDAQDSTDASDAAH